MECELPVLSAHSRLGRIKRSAIAAITIRVGLGAIPFLLLDLFVNRSSAKLIAPPHAHAHAHPHPAPTNPTPPHPFLKVCSIWTRNRKTILAAAVASAEADAKAGGGGVAPVVAEEASSRRPGVGSGEGEPAGRLTKGVYYHGLKDSKVRGVVARLSAIDHASTHD